MDSFTYLKWANQKVREEVVKEKVIKKPRILRVCLRLIPFNSIYSLILINVSIEESSGKSNKLKAANSVKVIKIKFTTASLANYQPFTYP